MAISSSLSSTLTNPSLGHSRITLFFPKIFFYAYTLLTIQSFAQQVGPNKDSDELSVWWLGSLSTSIVCSLLSCTSLMEWLLESAATSLSITFQGFKSRQLLSMQKQVFEAGDISNRLQQLNDLDPEKHFFCGYLFCKYQLNTAADLTGVLKVLDKFYGLLVTPKQKNSVLQKLAVHDNEYYGLGELEADLFEYVDEVVPHLDIAGKLEKARKISLELEESAREKTLETAMTVEVNKTHNVQTEMECPICLEGILSAQLLTLSCSHSFHKVCTVKSFENRIDSGLFPVLCPEGDCQKEVDNKNIFEALTQEYRDKHQSFSFRKFVEDNYETMCWCLSVNCEYIFCFEVGQSTFTCPLCVKTYCLDCRSQFHTGLTCKEYSKSREVPEEDEKFYEFAQGARYKQCPRCQYWVEKSQGCDHMTCRCHFEFCYICGEDYNLCACNPDDEAERAEVALQIAAEQLRLIGEGLREHQRQLERLQGFEQNHTPPPPQRQTEAQIETIERRSLGERRIEDLPSTTRHSEVNAEKTFPETSAGSSEKQRVPTRGFEFRFRPSFGNTHSYTSPPPRKTFKTSTQLYNLEPRKVGRSFEKALLRQQGGMIPRLVFNDGSDRRFHARS